MGDPVRTFRDIKKITILTQVEGVNGWVVEMRYLDDKAVAFSIDHSRNPKFDMLEEVFRCIRLQLKGTK